MHIYKYIGNAEIVKLLIRNHAEINAPDDMGDVPLSLAVKNGN